MRMTLFVILVTLVSMTSVGWSADGLVSVKSPHGVNATVERLKKLLEDKGLKIFARIDHAAGAAKIGKNLRPTQLLIFGNPQGGTPFMECQQTVGIDLPLKALVWEDADGRVWLGYNDPEFLAQRHGVPQCPVAEKLKKALAVFARQAVSP